MIPNSSFPYSGHWFTSTDSAWRLRNIRGQRTSITSEKWSKKSTEYLHLFLDFCHCVPWTTEQYPIPNLPSSCNALLEKPFMLLFTSFASVSSSWVLAFLTQFLQIWTMSLCLFHASTIYIFAFHAWAQSETPVYPCLPFCHSFLTGRDKSCALKRYAWRLASFPGPLCPSWQFPMGISWAARWAGWNMLKSRVVILVLSCSLLSGS